MSGPKSCSDFEIAIEQRLRGFLPPDEAAALDAHLATCATCTAYLATASKSQDLLAGISRTAVEGADWQRATLRFQATLQARRRRIWQGLAVLLLMAPFAAWALGSNGAEMVKDTLLAMLEGGVVLGVVATRTFLASRRLARELERPNGEELLELQRRYLRGRLRALTWTRVLAVPPLLGAIACALIPGLLRGAHPTLGFGVTAAIVGAGWLRLHLRDLPRVRRELAELGETPSP
jgi:hypothetical protein